MARPLLKYFAATLLFFCCYCGSGFAQTTRTWVGTTTDFNLASNWTPSAAPNSSDDFVIGSSGGANQPIVTTAASVRSLTISTANPAATALTLTLNADLTIVNDLVINSTLGNNCGVTLSGSSNKITVGGSLKVGDATTSPGTNSKAFSGLTSSVGQLLVTGNLTLASVRSTPNRIFNASLAISSGIVSGASVVTSFTGGTPYTSGLSVASGATLNLTGATPFSGLSATLALPITLSSGSTIGYTGTGQTVYTTISNSSLSGGVTYSNVNFSGSGSKDVQSGTFSAGGTLTTSGTPTVNFLTNNTTVSVNAITNGTGCTITQGGGTLSVTTTFGNNGTFTGSGVTATIGGITTLSAGSVTTGSGAFSTAGLLVNGGTFTGVGNVTSTALTRLNSVSGLATFGSGTTNLQAGLTVDAGAITFAGGATTVTGVTTVNSGTINFGTGTANLQTGLTVAGGTVNAAASPGILGITGAFSSSGTGTFSAGTGAVTFNGNYTNGGNFTYGAGSITFNSASAQALVDNSSLPNAPTIFKNVTFQGGGTKTMSGTGTFSVANTGVLTMAGSAQLATGGKLTLKSGALSSAAVAVIPSLASITGNVTVERYVTGGAGYRGYRLFSSPVYEATVSLTNVYGVAYTINSAYLTGTTGSAGGFDLTSTAPTIYLYREDLPQSSSLTGGNFRGVNKINNSPNYNLNLDNEGSTIFNIPVGNGFMFFFRGNRATNASINTAIVPDPATFSNTGTLNQGDIAVKSWYLGGTTLGYTPTAAAYSKGFNLVGNPYASTIDWNSFSTGISGVNIADATYSYNAKLKKYAVWDGVANTGTFDATQYIPSGQGFFVLATAASPALTFTESAKVPTQQVTGVSLFMGTPVAEAPIPQFLRLQLQKDTLAKEDVLLVFNKSATDNFILGEDLPYMRGSSAVSLSTFAVDNREAPLVVNRIPFPKQRVSIPLNVLTTASGTYQLALTEAKNIPQMFDVLLKDAYLNDSLALKTGTTYNFNVNSADATTFGADRFKLVVRPNLTYSYHLLDFTAAKQTTSVQVSWKVENEENYTYFTVERSTDGGNTFDVIGSAVGKSQGTYSLEDKAPATGENQYRLKQEDFFGTITYSKIVSVLYEPAKTEENIITVYPNPVSSNITIAVKIESTYAVPYSMSITNTSGRVVKTITSAQNSWQGNVSDLLPGTYFVVVTRVKDKSVVGQSTFIKL